MDTFSNAALEVGGTLEDIGWPKYTPFVRSLTNMPCTLTRRATRGTLCRVSFVEYVRFAQSSHHNSCFATIITTARDLQLA